MKISRVIVATAAVVVAVYAVRRVRHQDVEPPLETSARSPDTVTLGRPHAGAPAPALTTTAAAPRPTTRSTRNLGGYRFPDKDLGTRTPVGKSFEKVVYSVDDYNTAYPDKKLGTRQTLFANTAGAANITELQGHGDQPLVTLPQVLISCPPAAYNTMSGVTVYLDKQGQIEEAVSADGNGTAPAAVNDCQFHPFMSNGDASEAVVTIPPKGVIEQFNQRAS